MTAWLCERYDIDPHGFIDYKGIKVPTILCHWDAYLLGLGSGHDDIYDWFPKIIGKNMEDVRNDVAALLQKVGWVYENGNWYFYVNGEYVTGWKKIKKKWYFFDTDGVMKTGWVHEGNKWYYMDESGAMVTGWQYIDDKWYFFKGSGLMQTGWQKWKDEWYYLNNDGSMAVGWKEVGKATYYFHKNGDMVESEWIHDFPVGGGEKRGYYWIGKTGKFTYLHVGAWHEKEVDGTKKWWFGDDTGWYAKNETVVIDGKEYTFDSEGYLVD